MAGPSGCELAPFEGASGADVVNHISETVEVRPSKLLSATDDKFSHMNVSLGPPRPPFQQQPTQNERYSRSLDGNMARMLKIPSNSDHIRRFVSTANVGGAGERHHPGHNR